VLLSWRQILRLLMRWDPLIQYTAWLHELEAAMNDRPTAHKMQAMDQPERNILKDLREILLAADTTIPSTLVESSKQRFLTLCNQLRKVNLFGMSYPLLAVLNVVELFKVPAHEVRRRRRQFAGLVLPDRELTLLLRRLQYSYMYNKGQLYVFFLFSFLTR